MVKCLSRTYFIFENSLDIISVLSKVGYGKWRSLGGTRQFRVKTDDYLGNHGIGRPLVPNTPHVHFEFLNPKGNKFEVIKNIHVPLR